ncbi:hypothetical protein LSH36_756g02040 [Paralvinella palmiformis]|uniref:Lysosomal dipeptide transporter MFSD1 n=1 Tax=Paralvinella palmiformis TaxID=53620 RepID=A0AAD9J0J4_9ANNE|nr:hypothetical protein LSH36_756g02040 [Paralvinella palmiformis]
MVSPTDCVYRFIVLFFTCMMTFGSYFCFDMPSVLQTQFQANTSCIISNGTNTSKINESCCDDCLGMTPEEYNLLYAIYAWTNAIVVIGAGFLVDKMGNTVGLFLFSFLCLGGSSVFAIGAMMRGTASMLPLMLIGRLVFGSGNGSLTVVQYRIISIWFKNKELAMAFGTVLAFSRLGSVLNFLLTANFAKDHGIIWTLWGGAVLCGLGFVSAIVTSILDRYGMKIVGAASAVKVEPRKVKCSDIKYFSARYWILTFTLVFFYNGVFPFVADASKFIQDKYGYSKQTSSYLAGALYDVSMVLSPFLGFVVDQIGMRGIIALCCALLTIPVFGLLAFTYVHPLVSTLWLGITYSFAAPSLWPSIPLVVSPSTVGTATGITSSFQMIGIGISNLVVGKILGDQDSLPKKQVLLHWKYVMIYLFANTVACAVCAGLLIIVDRRSGGMLNQNKRQRMAQAALEEAHNQGQQQGSSTLSSSEEEGEPSERDPLLPPSSEPGSTSINYTE